MLQAQDQSELVQGSPKENNDSDFSLKLPPIKDTGARKGIKRRLNITKMTKFVMAFSLLFRPGLAQTVACDNTNVPILT